MKILFVATISDTVNGFLIPHIKSLALQGNRVGVAANPVEPWSFEFHELNCKVHPVEFQRNPLKKENYFAYHKIKRIVEEEGYDIVHVHTPVASFLTRFACRRMKDVKVIYTAHGFHFFKGASLKNWILYYPLERLAARWTDGIITMNDEDYRAAKRLKRKKEDSVYKIHGIGVDLNRFVPQTSERKSRLRKEYEYKQTEFILIYAAEISYRKNQELLIRAVSLVKKDIPELKLLLAGDGDMEADYKELAKNLGVEEVVEFLGFRHDIPALMQISDAAVSSSRQEGLPVNIMEAMGTGLPLIATSCRGNSDLVINGENGLLIGINDVDACAEAIKKLYKSETLRRRLGERNKRLIEQYSVDRVLSEMNIIYADLSLFIEDEARIGEKA